METEQDSNPTPEAPNPKRAKALPGEIKADRKIRLRRFVDEYIRSGFNGCAAARAVGISDVSAGNYASRALKTDYVKARLVEYARDMGVNPHRVGVEIAKGAFHFDPADYEDLMSGKKTLKELRDSGVDTRAIQDYESYIDANGNRRVRIRFYDRQKYLEQLTTITQLAKPQISVTVDNHTNVKVSESDVIQKLKGDCDEQA